MEEQAMQWWQQQSLLTLSLSRAPSTFADRSTHTQTHTDIYTYKARLWCDRGEEGGRTEG